MNLDQLVKDLVREAVAETLRQLQPAAPPDPPEPVCYTEEQAAEILGVPERSLRDARRRGEIQFSRTCGDRVRYTTEDLKQYLAARKGKATGRGKKLGA